ncbi:MAG TPA: hypothetical protein VFP59_14315 [Candidatus Angelobacter sp.]|nr:hypothetical protein [Candidatus Angelobacter sp.]
MKDYLSSVDLAIWIVLISSQIVLCFCSLSRGLARRLPWFTLYIFVSTAESLCLFAFAFLASYATYYHVFYLAGHLVSVAAFLTLVEFGRQVLPGLKLPDREKAIAWLLAALGMVVLFVAAWPLRSIANEKKIEVAACLWIAVAFIFTAGYARYLGLHWSRLLGGVAFTLGVLYLIDGATKAIIGHYPSALVLPIRQFREITNILAVVAWTVVVVSPWGEYEMTEETLSKARGIIGGVESSLRRFSVEESR